MLFMAYTDKDNAQILLSADSLFFTKYICKHSMGGDQIFLIINCISALKFSNLI